MAKKRGTKITFEEKIQIQTFLAEGKTVKEIGLELNRSVPAVKKYIDEFKNIIGKIDILHTPDQDMPKNIHVDLDMYNETLKYMRLDGLANETARSRLNAIIMRLKATPLSSKDLAEVAIKSLTPHELMATKSVGGRDGITTMTEAASYRGDAGKPKSQKHHNCLYSAKTGEPI